MKQFIKNYKPNQIPKKTLLLDWNNAMYKTLYTAYKNSIVDDNYKAWKFTIIKDVLDYIKQFEPTQVIVACDSKSWRKDYYPEYKAHRKDARDASPINYDEFYKVNDILVEQLKATFRNIHWLKIDKCEVDDIIAVLVKEFDLGDVVIGSTDKDFLQLLKNPKVKLYSLLKHSYIESMNPDLELDIKIIMGDRGDNIPAILPKTGPVKAAKLLEEGVLLDDENFTTIIEAQGIKLKTIIDPEDIKKNIERNKTLISFEKIPEEIKTSVINTFVESKLESFSNMKFLTFCVANKLPKLQSEISNYAECLKRLTTEETNERTCIRNKKEV